MSVLTMTVVLKSFDVFFTFFFGRKLANSDVLLPRPVVFASGTETKWMAEGPLDPALYGKKNKKKKRKKKQNRQEKE